MPATSRPRDRSRRRQTQAATVLAAGAGASTALLPLAPIVMLAIVAACAAIVTIGLARTRTPWTLGAAVVGSVAVHVPGLRLDVLARGVVLGLLVALVIALPLLLRRAIERDLEYRRRGWALAAAETKRHHGATRAAVQRERMALAAEMHDGLGHALTLIAVRLGRLSLTSSMPASDRLEVDEIRHLAAGASEELGVAVRLLRESDDAAVGWMPPALDEAIAGARDAGMHVDDDIAPAARVGLGDETTTALARIVQEGLTNAAKHAPGHPLAIRVRSDEHDVRLTMQNRAPSHDVQTTPPDAGTGLDSLRHRAAMLGGDLTADSTDGTFVLEARLPRQARPVAPDAATQTVADAEDVAAGERARSKMAAIVVPGAIVAALGFVAAGYFVLTNTVSVIDPEAFAEIEVGDDRAAVEAGLPPLELLDPPIDEYPAAPGETCRYYEAEVSFFDRVDVFVICFDADHVTSTGTVPAS